MKRILLRRQDHVALMDDCDADLAELPWYAVEKSPGVYAMRTVRGKTILLHRVIAERKLGHSIPRGMCVDHIDGYTLDNRRDNLRVVTQSENLLNNRNRRRKAAAVRYEVGLPYKDD